MKLEIYPRFQIGQKVKAYQNIVYEGEVKSIPIILYGTIKEIRLQRDFLFGHLMYLYVLDSGEIFNEFSLIERND